MNKKGIAIMWMMFFVVLVTFSGAYAYFLANKFVPETKLIGSLEWSLKKLINEVNMFNFNV